MVSPEPIPFLPSQEFGCVTGLPVLVPGKPPGCSHAQYPVPSQAGRTLAKVCRAIAAHLAPVTRWQLSGEWLRLPLLAHKQKMRVTLAGWGFYSPDKNSAGWPVIGGPERCD